MINHPMRASSLDHQFPMEVHLREELEIRNPGEHDVLLGRGGGTNGHAGNINFRELVKRHKKDYLAATKIDKPKVAKRVVEIWQSLNPPGRFLARRDDSKKGPGSVRDENIVWVEVDVKEARKKASQCLREKTEDVKDYVEQLRKEQDKQTEEGVSKVGEKIKQTKELNASTPDSTGSASTARIRNHPHSALSEDTISHMPDRPVAPRVSSMRRTSMPATVHSVTDGIAGGGMARYRTQDRRTSMPVGGQRVHQNQEIDFDLLMANHREVIRDAYTAVERPSDLSPVGMSSMQQQQQQMQAMRARMLQAGRTMSPPLSQSMNGMNGMGIAFPQNSMQPFGQTPMSPMSPTGTMSAREQLMQQQLLLAEQQQQILKEQERLVRQEHMLAQMTRQGQPNAFAGQQMMSPQYSQMHVSQSGIGNQGNPMYPVNSQGLQSLQEERAGKPDMARSSNETYAMPQTHAAATRKMPKSSLKKSPGDNSKPRARPAELTRPANRTQKPTANGEDHPEYRKTLEKYIANNQGSLASLDLNDDSFENSGTVNGVEADEWIEEQVLHNSGEMSGSNRGSLRRDRTVGRTKSNKSVDMMSLATGTLGSIGGGDQMSFAFSEMDAQSVELEDLSKGEREHSKRGNSKRSMSILSVGTAMSDITDFDIGELEGTNL